MDTGVGFVSETLIGCVLDFRMSSSSAASRPTSSGDGTKSAIAQEHAKTAAIQAKKTTTNNKQTNKQANNCGEQSGATWEQTHCTECKVDSTVRVVLTHDWRVARPRQERQPTTDAHRDRHDR